MIKDERNCPTARRGHGLKKTFRLPLTALVAATALVAPTPTAHAWEGASDTHTTRIDVDGDGRADTVRTSIGDGGLYVTVDTAARRTASLVMRDGRRWSGAAPIDGRPGAELIFDINTDGDSGYQRVFTWRAGKLVASPVPVAVCGSRDWCSGDPHNGLMGYALSTARGVRYLAVTQGRWRGNVALRTTFRWSADRWKAVTSRQVRLSPTAERQAAGWRGIVLHRGVAEAAPAAARPAVTSSRTLGSVLSRHRIDVDGDRRADTVTVTRVGEERQAVSVTTARGRTSRAIVPYGFYAHLPRTTLYGAADLDGAAGKDLVVTKQVGEHAQLFDVLTWRNNRLVTLPNPADPKGGWRIDFGYSAAGIRVTGGGTKMRLITTRSDLLPTSGTYSRATTLRTYAWRSGTWKLLGTTHRKDTESTSPSGWYVKGLPGYRTD